MNRVLRIMKRELWDRKWPLFWYSFTAVALLWIYAATYKSSAASAQQLLDVVKSYPKALIEAFGLGSLASSSIEQFLNGKHFSFLWPLMAILFALSRAGSQLAGEIQDRTMGLLLSSPVSRLSIFAAKYLAGLMALVVFTSLSIFPIIPLASAYGIDTHWHILASAWVLATLFIWSVYTFGLLLSSLFSQTGRVYAIGSGVLLVSYVANLIALLDDKLDRLKFASIFHYFDTAAVLGTGHISRAAIMVFAGIIIISTIIAAWRFNRRDMFV